MTGYTDIASFFEEKSPDDITRFVGKNLDITEQVYKILEEKGWSQKDLARMLEKTDAEVSKWLSGTHNLTLRSITKMEAALGRDIILTPQKVTTSATTRKEIKYVRLSVHANTNLKNLSTEGFDGLALGGGKAASQNSMAA
jgi:transcriptional regulator with XRE-family HTH domain